MVMFEIWSLGYKPFEDIPDQKVQLKINVTDVVCIRTSCVVYAHYSCSHVYYYLHFSCFLVYVYTLYTCTSSVVMSVFLCHFRLTFVYTFT